MESGVEDRLDTMEKIFYVRTDRMMADVLSSDDFLRGILKKASEIIAGEITKHHLPEVLEKISPEAIANMTIAAAGAKINETLAKKTPDSVLNIETKRTEVYQRGVFGGLKRL